MAGIAGTFTEACFSKMILAMQEAGIISQGTLTSCSPLIQLLALRAGSSIYLHDWEKGVIALFGETCCTARYWFGG
jgi:hypothetical protein